MPCQCQQTVMTAPNGDCLPNLEDACALEKPSVICHACSDDGESLQSDASPGTTLNNSFLDAICATSNITILGRVGSKLARFSGSGFIQLVAGKARVVQNVPLKVSTLWHHWWKPTANSVPILGEPLAFPFQVIGDTKGNLHAIRGTSELDSITVWNKTEKVFEQLDFDVVAERIFPAATLDNYVTIFNTALND